VRPLDPDELAPDPVAFFPPPPPARAPVRDRLWLHLLTVASTTMAGANMYAGFLSQFGYRQVHETAWQILQGGLWFSLPALAILGCHEMGHYLACRYYRVDASLPFFLPMPLVLFGTMGAVIRIRDPIPTKRMLFDIGVAGPIAGFIVAIPTLILGTAWSHVTRLPPNLGGLMLGEPLLFQGVQRAFFGHIPEGYTVNSHPLIFAAWFGLLATSLNLLPVGQLDGGHIAYANLGTRSRYVTLGTLAAMLVLGVTMAPSWLVWCGLIGVLLVMTGWQHPPTLDDHVPLDASRVWVSILAVLIFIACFTPAPITPTELLR
jgi:membrane-associated protease RseP (regulator of RpoE activity)